MKNRMIRSMLSASLVAALAACGGGSDPAPATETPPAVTATVTGTAATGAPVAGGNVSVQCATGPVVTTTTSATGTWTVDLTTQTFPCLVTVSGGSLPAGQPLHSLALAAGNVNVTPLTSLIMALGLNKDPASLGTALPTVAAATAALQEGQTEAAAFLKAAGYPELPANPLTAQFTAAEGDAYDDLIHQLTRSMGDAGVPLAELLTAASSGTLTVADVPLTHVFNATELAAIPQLNKAAISASGGELTMALTAGTSAVGSFVGGGNGNKAVLQLPGLAGTRLKDLKSMSLEMKGDPYAANPGRIVYPYVNFTVDLQCDGSALPANATLAQVRAKRRIVIYDPFVKFVQTAQQPLNASAYTTVAFDFATPGWRISGGTPVGTVAVNPNYQGNETLEGFDFTTYPNACIVDAATGDGGMYRDAAADAACATSAGLAADAPAACGKAYSGVQVIVGDSATDVAASWKVKNIKFEATNTRSFAFE